MSDETRDITVKEQALINVRVYYVINNIYGMQKQFPISNYMGKCAKYH